MAEIANGSSKPRKHRHYDKKPHEEEKGVEDPTHRESLDKEKRDMILLDLTRVSRLGHVFVPDWNGEGTTHESEALFGGGDKTIRLFSTENSNVSAAIR